MSTIGTPYGVADRIEMSKVVADVAAAAAFLGAGTTYVSGS